MTNEELSILKRITAITREVPEPVLEALIKSLQNSGVKPTKSEIKLISSQIIQPSVRALVLDLFHEWRENNYNPDSEALAWALKSACYADRSRRESQKLELVWTGPTTLQSNLRRTDQVLLNLIDDAQESLIIITFAAYKIPDVSAGLVRAAERGVHIVLILESAEVSIGKVAHEALAALGGAVAQLSEVYVWPIARRPKDKNGHHGSLHVKCAIADESITLISSANLTEYALNLNMELGTMIRGGSLPRQAAAHIRSLIENGTLMRIADN
ncbi:MAG: DISARM system phospholipase D-like protein DrmC [Armatimonadetes bacterium]|nr:DISARM system phospholipase D-like protein DrmC [Armatimonadota bacterium]